MCVVYIYKVVPPIYPASNTNGILALKEPSLHLHRPRASGRTGFWLGMAAPAMLQVVILAAVLLLPFLSVPGAEAQTKKFCLTQFAIASQACAILPPTSPEHHHHHHDDEDNDEDNDEDEDEDEDNDEDEDEDNDDDSGGGGDRRRRPRDQGKKSDVVSKPTVSSASKPAVSSMITVEAVTDDDDRNGTTGHSSVAVVGNGNHTHGGGSVRHHRSRSRRRRRRRHRHGRLRDGDEDNDEDEDEDEDNDEDEDEDDDEDDGEDDDDDDDEDDHRAYRDCCRWLKEVEPDCVCEALLRLPPFLVKPQHKYTVKVGNSCKFTYRCGGV